MHWRWLYVVKEQTMLWDVFNPSDARRDCDNNHLLLSPSERMIFPAAADTADCPSFHC